MRTVKAMREKLVGKPTSTGYRIDKRMPFVALPARDALYRFIHLHALETDRRCIAIVLDIGPWNFDDDDYVFGDASPLSTKRIKNDGTNEIEGDTNGAGIALGEAVWYTLRLPLNNGNTEVEWEFITPYSTSIQTVTGK
jgi:hypothetical protein